MRIFRSAGLELCAHVGVNFAAENNFFENGTGPSHNFHPRVRDFSLAEPSGATLVGIENDTTVIDPFVRKVARAAWPEGAIFVSGGTQGANLGFPTYQQTLEHKGLRQKSPALR